jgi:hypothetical protein
MEKKKFNPLDETLKLGQIGAGTMMAGSMPHIIGKSLPGTSSTASRIGSATGKVLPLLPMTQGISSVFGSLGNLQDIEKKIKKKR